MKKILFLLLTVFAVQMNVQAQHVKLNSEGRDAEYVKTILGRSQKIVDGLALKDKDAAKARNVLYVIANRYFTLNDIHEACDQKVKWAKDSLASDERKHVIGCAKVKRDAELYKHHFEFEATLSLYLTPEQVEAVKDGLTYQVVPKTYQAHLDMIPSLKEEEKAQILAWLKEAREFAIDASTSKAKHEWFGKYKGRINNWLSQRGYDLLKEREAWYKRMDAAGIKY